MTKKSLLHVGALSLAIMAGSAFAHDTGPDVAQKSVEGQSSELALKNITLIKSRAKYNDLLAGIRGHTAGGEGDDILFDPQKIVGIGQIGEERIPINPQYFKLFKIDNTSQNA